MLLGRGLRFGAEAWLGARYGVQAQYYVRHNLAWVSLVIVLAIVGFALLQRKLGGHARFQKPDERIQFPTALICVAPG